MEISDTDYIACHGFAENDQMNFTIMIIRRDDKWFGEARFRVFKDDKVFNSDDKRITRCFQPPAAESVDAVIAGANIILDGVVKNFECRNREMLDVRGGAKLWQWKAAQTSWCQMKMVSKEDFANGAY